MIQHPTALALIRFWPNPRELVVPVKGVTPEALHSSFGEPRSGRRTHAGIDIFARRGTPVLAAAPGRVTRVGHNTLGGKVRVGGGRRRRASIIIRTSTSFAPGCGRRCRRREANPLGRVGNTGNAATTPPHLHFGIYPMSRLSGRWIRRPFCARGL